MMVVVKETVGGWDQSMMVVVKCVVDERKQIEAGTGFMLDDITCGRMPRDAVSEPK